MFHSRPLSLLAYVYRNISTKRESTNLKNTPSLCLGSLHVFISHKTAAESEKKAKINKTSYSKLYLQRPQCENSTAEIFNYLRCFDYTLDIQWIEWESKARVFRIGCVTSTRVMPCEIWDSHCSDYEDQASGLPWRDSPRLCKYAPMFRNCLQSTRQ